MKHASTAALANLSALLARVRSKPGVTEPHPGVCHRKSKAFLHFHEDPQGLFADLRAGAGFDRYPVNTPSEQQALLAARDRALAP